MAAAIPPELNNYIGTPDKSFAWKLIKTEQKKVLGGLISGTVYTIEMVSQTWHGVAWDHTLQVFVPRGVTMPNTMALWVEGDIPKNGIGGLDEETGVMLASQMRAPFAILYGVPKQPLFGDKAEDALIAESFVRYLTTEVASWPLLFPMVKSVVRGMDALQAFASQHLKVDVKQFVIAGASKRGWTTWLTAATGDKRVKAIAPLVFDMVKMGSQIDLQIANYGKPSEMIKDYSDRLLLPIPKTDPAVRLWKMIDPWTYRERLDLPKLIVNGTNDEFWTLDSLNLYWDGLKGDKWVMYVPNAGHYLKQRDEKGNEEKMPMQAVNTLVAFCRSQIHGKPMPNFNCDMVCPPGAICLDMSVMCDVKPSSCRVLSTDAGTRDFRNSYWKHESLTPDGMTTTCKVNLPKAGHRAALLELEFEMEGLKYKLSTPPRIIEARKK